MLSTSNMAIVSAVLVTLIALEHFWFLVLEMFLWTRPLGLKTFGMTSEQAAASANLAANQGLYNGFIGAGLLWGLTTGIDAVGLSFRVFFLVCVIIAGAYGALTVSRRIFWVQAFPALIALIAVLSSVPRPT